jgi:hypothetical protein
MSAIEWAQLLVALGLVLLTFHRALPALILRWHPESLACRFLGPEEEGPILDGSPLLQELIDRAKRLHYSLLGVKVEKMPLWGGRFSEVTLAARDQSAFASIVLHPFGAPASLYFYTPLSAGGMAFTRDFAGGAQIESPGLSVANVPSEELEVVHQAHQQRVAALRAQGYASEVRPSQAGRIAATHAFYASAYYRRLSAGRDRLMALSCAASIALMLWAGLSPLLGS